MIVEHLFIDVKNTWFENKKSFGLNDKWMFVEETNNYNVDIPAWSIYLELYSIDMKNLTVFFLVYMITTLITQVIIKALSLGISQSLTRNRHKAKTPHSKYKEFSCLIGIHMKQQWIL